MKSGLKKDWLIRSAWLALLLHLLAPAVSYIYLVNVPHAYCPQHLRFEAVAPTFNGSASTPIPSDDALQHDDWRQYLFDLSHTQVDADPVALVSIVPVGCTDDFRPSDLVVHQTEPVSRAPKHSPPTA